MTEKSYSIAYGPPLTVKDQPHRANDTARSSRDVTELEPTQAGQVMVVGGFAESDSGEIIEIAAEKSYSIAYGPPLTVKDQPHRANDTAATTDQLIREMLRMR